MVQYAFFCIFCMTTFTTFSVSPAHVVKPLLSPNTINDPRSCLCRALSSKFGRAFFSRWLWLVRTRLHPSFLQFFHLVVFCPLVPNKTLACLSNVSLSSSSHVLFTLIFLSSSNLNTKILDFTTKLLLPVL